MSQTRGFPFAVLLGKILSAPYMQMILSNPGYVQEMKIRNRINEDEFHNTEITTDGLADYVAGYLKSKGYDAFSQSEKNLLGTGGYNTADQTTLLPHKTIALLAGLGWIGKNDLLVTPEYGCALSMCTVLTNAPVKTEQHPAVSSECGNCTVCVDLCQVQAINGRPWRPGIQRDEMVDVTSCTTCLLCMAACPSTRRYTVRACWCNCW